MTGDTPGTIFQYMLNLYITVVEPEPHPSFLCYSAYGDLETFTQLKLFCFNTL